MPKGYRINVNANRSQRRQVLFARVLSEVKFVTELKPHFSIDIETLRRISKPGGTQNPHRATDEEMARYLKVLQESYDQYLDETLTLNQLWDKRGENVPRYSPNQLSLDNVIELVRLLGANDRMELLQWLVSMLQKDTEDHSSPPVICLSQLATERVRSLFKFSILADEKKIDELGVDPILIDFLTKGTIDASFPASTWEALLPHLYRVSGWVESTSGFKPRMDYSRNYKDNLNLFLVDLEAENSVLSSGYDNQ